MMGIVFGIAFTLPWILVFMGTKEIAGAHIRKHRFGDFFKTFGSVFRNRSFRIHLGMYLCAYAAMDLVMATLRYFMKYTLNSEHLLTPALATLLVAQILMLPVYVRLANTKGKGFTYVLGLSIWALAILPTGFLPRDVSPAILLPLCALIGVGLSAGVMIPWAILPQVGDVDELMTGEKRIGIYSGVMTFVRKLVQALAIYGLSLALDLIGYLPGVEQSQNTLFFLRSLYVVAPTTVLVAGIYFGWRFPITPKVHALLATELVRRRAGGESNSMTDDVKKAYKACSGG
jgi:oligogalacturonide transporter